MAKKKAVAKPKPKRKPNPCKRAGCKKPTVYMKRNQKTGKMEHWCGQHWREDVEIPQGIAARKTVARYKKGHESRSALKGAAKKATDKPRVVRRKK